MSKESAIIFLGIFVIVVPFLGFPVFFKTIFFVVSGFLVSFLALLIYARERLMGSKKTRTRKRTIRRSPNETTKQDAKSIKTSTHDTTPENQNSED